jgi:hypothetical protein
VARSVIALVLTAFALSPGAAAAKPALCQRATIQQALIDAGRLTQEDVDNGIKVDLVRCGDVTADRRADALFTLASGGTAGDTRFGVLRGGKGLVLYKQGYKVGVWRRDSRSFEVIQPHYAADDPNCCPSSFRVRRYTWTGSSFRAGKARARKTAPARFYR